MPLATVEKKEINKLILTQLKELNLVPQDSLSKPKQKNGQNTTNNNIHNNGGIDPLALTERIVRVEEELKHQREIILTFQSQTDKRFEEMLHYMDKRFASMQWLIAGSFSLIGLLIALLKIFVK